MIEKNFEKNNENCIEWLSGERSCLCTFTNRVHINRVKDLYEKHKDEFGSFYENPDGSVCCKIPLKWIKVSYPRQVPKHEYSDEERAAFAVKMAEVRAKKNAERDSDGATE